MAKETAVTQKPKESEITGLVLNRINTFVEAGELVLPKDYSPANALKAAWLILQETQDSNKQPVLVSCSQESIANSLLKMVVWGLSPLKKQGDFIPYAGKLDFVPEYTGNIVLAKRYGGLAENPVANAIYKGDVFEFSIDPATGRKTVTKHEQKLENLGGEVVGAYCTYKEVNGNVNTEIMNILQIKNAWNQRKGNGLSPAHTNFSDEMAKKTVINRAMKLLIRGAADGNILAVAGDKEDDTPRQTKQEDVKKTIELEQGKETIHFDTVSPEPEPVEAVEVKETVNQESEAPF